MVTGVAVVELDRASWPSRGLGRGGSDGAVDSGAAADAGADADAAAVAVVEGESSGDGGDGWGRDGDMGGCCCCCCELRAAAAVVDKGVLKFTAPIPIE